MRHLLIVSATVLFSGAAFAQPPAGAMALSEIVASMEQQGDFGYIDEIEWDDDGYWEVEYYRADGAKVSVDIDPVSGSPR